MLKSRQVSAWIVDIVSDGHFDSINSVIDSLTVPVLLGLDQPPEKGLTFSRADMLKIDKWEARIKNKLSALLN